MQYYTYAYLREDKTPYYVGKGKGRRAFNNHKHIPVPKDKNRIIFLKQNLTEEDAFRHEIYMIFIFGRKDLGTGVLHNRTNGGDGGTFGQIPWNKGKTGVYTPETLNRMKKSLSLSFSGENNPMYGKYGKDHPAYGYEHSKETKNFLSQNQVGEKNHMYGRFGENNPNYGSKRSEESKIKMSEGRKGEKNHRYGKKSWNSGKSVMMWITNGVESRYVFKTEKILEGWRRGRTFSRKSNK
jgi:hypothetical protein